MTTIEFLVSGNDMKRFLHDMFLMSNEFFHHELDGVGFMPYFLIDV